MAQRNNSSHVQTKNGSTFDDLKANRGGLEVLDVLELIKGPETSRELAHALRSIRFGSIVLTIHDGELVEIIRTERLRVKPSNRRS